MFICALYQRLVKPYPDFNHYIGTEYYIGTEFGRHLIKVS